MRLQRLIPIVAVAILALADRPAWAAAPKVGAPAPSLIVRDLAGQELDLTKAAGRLLIVNIWATWCPPCRAEMPMLNAFYLDRKGQGVALVGVSADRSRDKDEVRRVMAQFSYPAALLSEAKVDRLDDPRVLPMTYVVDKAGVVRAVFGGAGKPPTRELLDDAIKPLL